MMLYNAMWYMLYDACYINLRSNWIEDMETFFLALLFTSPKLKCIFAIVAVVFVV